MKTLNVGIVGYKFMGKAHSNAWMKAPLFFDLPVKPVMKVACGRHEEPLKEFAERWGWEQIETDWKKLVERDDIDIGKFLVCIGVGFSHEGITKHADTQLFNLSHGTPSAMGNIKYYISRVWLF